MINPEDVLDPGDIAAAREIAEAAPPLTAQARDTLLALFGERPVAAASALAA